MLLKPNDLSDEFVVNPQTKQEQREEAELYYNNNEIHSDILISKNYMLPNNKYENLMNGIIFRRKVSQFLNIRVDFSVRNKVSLQLETVGSGFIQSLKTNTISDLHELERMFGFSCP